MDYEPVRRDRRERLEALRTGDGRPVPDYLKHRISRELDRLELLLEQIKAVEAQRDALLSAQESPQSTPKVLQSLRGVGSEFAAVLWSEGLFRDFENRRQLGLLRRSGADTLAERSRLPRTGRLKAGNARLRTTMIQLGWLWLRHQPNSALTLWFQKRASAGCNRRGMITALARKLLFGLWKFVTSGVVPEGAMLSAA